MTLIKSIFKKSKIDRNFIRASQKKEKVYYSRSLTFLTELNPLLHQFH